MLIAKNRKKASVPGWLAVKEDDYFCPECEQELILVQGEQVVQHFRHYHQTNCEAGETIEHMAMKKLCYDKFKAKLEVKIGGRRADAVVDDYVLECQHSPISLEEMADREADYQEAGYTVRWIWCLNRLTKIHRRFYQLQDWWEYRIPKEILACYEMHDGIAVCDGKDFEIVDLIETDERTRFVNGEWRTYTPKTKRFVRVREE